MQRAASPVDKPGRPSAKDVARLAGVSTATVSRVINSPEQVEARTQRLVRDAVDKLRYVPHGAARALRSARSHMVGAVVPSFDYALYARTTSAMQAVLDGKGYSLVLAEHHYDLGAELRTTEQLIRRGVDAFVFVGLDHDPALFALLESYGRPYVLTWGVDVEIGRAAAEQWWHASPGGPTCPSRRWASSSSAAAARPDPRRLERRAAAKPGHCERIGADCGARAAMCRSARMRFHAKHSAFAESRPSPE
jgi:hypothetical protein